MVDKTKSIVVFYSHGGNTAAVAHKIAQVLQCDEIRIEVPKSRQGFFGFFRLIKDGIKNRSTPIIIPEKNWTEYKTVVIGSPIWGGTYAAPIHTLLTQQLKGCSNYAIFSTGLGDHAPFIAAHMTGIMNNPPIAELHIQKKNLKNAGWEQKLDEFLKSLP